jgi:hypothetical protein
MVRRYEVRFPCDGRHAAHHGTLTFKPGETTKAITIVVNGDSKAGGTAQ